MTSLDAWLLKHGNDETRPNVDKVIAALKEQGVKAFGVTGYCFGGTLTLLSRPLHRYNCHSSIRFRSRIRKYCQGYRRFTPVVPHHSG